MPPLPSVSDVKTYIGLTGSGDDTMLAERLAAAVGMAERDTGRTISASSNTTRLYSTMGQSSFDIADVPMTDASRVVTWMGATLTESAGTTTGSVWFLPDRRDPNISHTVQIRYYDMSIPDWYKADPYWFDKNLDRRRFPIGTPNDFSIAGITGIPFPKADMTGAILVLTAFLYWRAKAGATGTAYAITGESVSLGETPPEYQAFVRDWKVATAVSSVG